MNGSQRYDYLDSTAIFLRNKEYERHQKKLDEIKNIKAKGTYYNKSHIEGIRVHNNIKQNNNKFKDRLKNDELQVNNNKILKKIIEISRHENALGKTHNSNISPRRANFEEVDKIIRENQILSNKINNVDSQLNNRKFATQYQHLFECRRRIQRFEVIDYEKNQVKLKAYELANSTNSGFNGGLTQAHSRLSNKKPSSQFNNNGDEIIEGNGSDEFSQQNDQYLINNQQRTKNIQINTNQNTPRGYQIDSGRAKSCERERTSVYKKQQLFPGQRTTQNNRDTSGENSHDIQNIYKPNRQIGTSETGRYRSASRGHGASTRNSQEPSKNTSDSQLPTHRYFRNYKRANPERQSLNLTHNSLAQTKLNMSDDQNLNKTGESQHKGSKGHQGTTSSNQTQDGQFYNEDNYGYGQEEEEEQGYNPKGPLKYNQNFVGKSRDNLQEDKKVTQTHNKDGQQQEKIEKGSQNHHQIKNSSRIQSAKSSQRENIRSGTPNKSNQVTPQQSHMRQDDPYQSSSRASPRNKEQVQQKNQEGFQHSQIGKKDGERKIQSSQMKNSSNRSQIKNNNDSNQNNPHHAKKQNQGEETSMKHSQKVEENISSQSKSLNEESEEIEDEYNFNDDDFVQQESSYQLDEATQKKFTNNSKNFYKDKKKEQYQIVEQEEYEEDFEPQMEKSSNTQNTQQPNRSEVHPSNDKKQKASHSKITQEEKQKSQQYNPSEDLQSSNNQYNTSFSQNLSEVNKSKIKNSQVKPQDNAKTQNNHHNNNKNVDKKDDQKKNNSQANQFEVSSEHNYEEEHFELDD